MVELKDQTSSFEEEDGIYGAYHITVVIEANLLFVNICYSLLFFFFFFFPRCNCANIVENIQAMVSERKMKNTSNYKLLSHKVVG